MLLLTSLSQRSVTRWRARAARVCLASSLARCVHLQQCITGNQSVCTNQFGTEGTRMKQQCTVSCSRLFTQLSRRNHYTSWTILKQHSPHDFLHNCGGDTTTIWGTLHTTNKSRVRPLQYRSDSVNDHPLAYYVSTHHCGYHKSSGSHTTAVFVAVLLLLPTSSSTDRQQLMLYLRGTSLVVSTCHSRSDVQPTCRDHPIHVCTKLNVIICGIKLFRGYWSQTNWQHANVTLDTVIPYRSVEYVANLETRAVCSSIPQHMLHNHPTC